MSRSVVSPCRWGGRPRRAGLRAACGGSVIGILILGCASGAFTQAQATATADASAALAPEAYRIGAGDRLQLFVWKEVDLTRELLVRMDGMVTVPLVGDIKAMGLTTAEVSTEIQRRLARFINGPNVTISVIAAQSAQIFILGRVARSGAYPLDRPTTFLQGLALAGGFTEFAKTDRVLVFRAGESRVIPVNYKKLEGGADQSENVRLFAGDTILVP